MYRPERPLDRTLAKMINFADRRHTSLTVGNPKIVMVGVDQQIPKAISLVHFAMVLELDKDELVGKRKPKVDLGKIVIKEARLDVIDRR